MGLNDEIVTWMIGPQTDWRGSRRLVIERIQKNFAQLQYGRQGEGYYAKSTPEVNHTAEGAQSCLATPAVRRV